MKDSRWEGKVTVYTTDGKIYNQIYRNNKKQYQIQVNGKAETAWFGTGKPHNK